MEEKEKTLTQIVQLQMDKAEGSVSGKVDGGAGGKVDGGVIGKVDGGVSGKTHGKSVQVKEKAVVVGDKDKIKEVAKAEDKVAPEDKTSGKNVDKRETSSAKNKAGGKKKEPLSSEPKSKAGAVIAEVAVSEKDPISASAGSQIEQAKKAVKTEETKGLVKGEEKDKKIGPEKIGPEKRTDAPKSAKPKTAQGKKEPAVPKPASKNSKSIAKNKAQIEPGNASRPQRDVKKAAEPTEKAESAAGKGGAIKVAKASASIAANKLPESNRDGQKEVQEKDANSAQKKSADAVSIFKRGIEQIKQEGNALEGQNSLIFANPLVKVDSETPPAESGGRSENAKAKDSSEEQIEENSGKKSDKVGDASKDAQDKRDSDANLLQRASIREQKSPEPGQKSVLSEIRDYPEKSPKKEKEAPRETEKQEKKSTNHDLDKTSKSSHLSVCQTQEESKIEESQREKQSFERMLPIRSDLTSSYESNVHANVRKDAVRKEQENTPAIPENTNSPQEKAAQHSARHEKEITAQKEEENRRRRVDRPNQSFAGLKPEELKEKTAELNQLLSSMKTKLKAQDQKDKRKEIGEPVEREVVIEKTPIKEKSEQKLFSPVIDSSDDEIRNPVFSKKQWVDSPSLPKRLMLQNENEAARIFGSSVNTKVNLKEMFSGLKNLPPDSPNRFG